MDSYPNPYAALIATFNQVSPLEGQEELDDPQHLSDDDLWLWANAEFKYDMPPGVGIYEDEMGVKLAMSQQQFQQTQQHQLQHQQQQQQQQQPQSHVTTATSQAPSHSIQYQLQFDALHRYLDANSEERSRQRNPVVTAGPSQSPVQFNPTTTSTTPTSTASTSIFPQHSHADSSSTAFSAPTATGTISPVAARLLRQPFLALQHHSSPYSVGGSPLPSPTTMSDFRQLQINPPLPSPVTTSKPSDDIQVKRSLARKDDATSIALSGPNSPAHSTTSVAATVSSPHEDGLNSTDGNGESLDTLDLEDQEEESGSSSHTKIPKAIQGLSPEDPEYAAKLAAEEDKRRRNTAASARFRHKKRLREQILEKTAKEMTAKSELLEIRVRELEMEIKWLRGLIVEKDSRMVDVGISPAAVAAAAAAAAAAASGSSSTSASSPGSSFSLAGVSSSLSTAALSELTSSLSSASRVKSESKAEGATAMPRKRSKKAPKA
ncbi:hypothetical protein BGX34_002483 [Mortierella sp. NVP85]|nr:hypothetical protein BGX34_002483 [Mortierella sp. NVP85]